MDNKKFYDEMMIQSKLNNNNIENSDNRSKNKSPLHE